MMARHALAVLACAAAASASRVGAGPWPSAEPYWPHYTSRKVTVLNGTWQFGWSQLGDPTTIAYSDVQTPNTTVVPGSWDIAPMGVLGPRGNAYFRSTHGCTPGVPALLKFGAVNFYARVFVDGAELGNHTAGGYTPFQMQAPACSASGQREVLVVTNNNANYTTNPTNTGGDFYFYSGIIRPVVVTELPTAAPYFIDRVEPISKSWTAMTVDVRVVLGGNVAGVKSVNLAVAFNGAALGQYSSYMVVNGTALIAGLHVPGTQPWGLRQGNLFTLQVAELKTGDSITVRSGVRVLGTTPQGGFTINGQVVKLLGFNRHTLWADTGAAVTPEQEAVDLQLLLGLNVNYVRGAHYPQSQSWLDRLDEAGIALWEEALGPGTKTSDFTDPWFMSNHLTAVASMVQTSFAHPAVIFHAFFNEGPSDDPNACVGYAASAAAIKSRVGEPAMRLVTWASDKDNRDVCIQYEDTISFNNYPGWYGEPGNVSYAPVYWASMVQWVEQNWPSKPFTVSETGGGGIYEWGVNNTAYPGIQWTQEYQTNLVSADANFLASTPRVTGLTLWQFSDIKANDDSTRGCGQCVYPQPTPANLTVPWDCAYISPEQIKCGRPKGENNKGSVDLWRRPKAEYPIVAAIYKKWATGV